MGRITVRNDITSEEKISQINPKNMDLLNDFMDYLVSIDRSPNTIAGYKSDLLIFFCWNIENNENKYFIDLTKREVAKFQKHAMTEWKWSSNRLARVKSSLSSLSNYIETMLDDEYENYRAIIRKVESPVKQPVLTKTIITDQEVNDVLDKLIADKKYVVACAFALAAFGGARKSELLRYKVSYFDDCNIMSDAALYKTPEPIKTKGRGSQGKALIKYTLLDFKKYLDLWLNEKREKNYVDSEYIFSRKDGETLKIGGMDAYADIISNYLEKPFYFHALRHQLCTRLFKLGLPSDVIQEYFGWSSAEMLSIYNDAEASDSFGKFFTSEGIKGSENKGLSNL